VDLEKILREIESLKKAVRRLSKEIESIKAISMEDTSAVERLLRMRGIKIFRKNPTEQLFFPSDLPPFYNTRFYEMMKRYSFRLVIRDIVKYQERFRIQDLTHYCSQKAAQEYCNFLLEIRAILKNGRERYRTRISPLYSFGPTLEWFVAEMFKREFGLPCGLWRQLKEDSLGG
jgi:hypothetical protein